MSSTDAMIGRTGGDPVGNLHALLAGVPDGPERLALIDRWVGHRVALVQDAEARIDRKLATLTGAEDRLRDLFDAFRRQIAEAQPMLSQLSGFRASAQACVDEVLGAARGQLSEAVGLVRSRIDQLEAAQQSAAQVVEHLPACVDEQLGRVESAVNEKMRAAIGQASAHARELTTASEAVGQWIDRKKEQAVADVREGARADIEAAEREWQGRIVRQMDRSERQVANLLESLGDRAGKVAAQVESQILERASEIGSQAHRDMERRTTQSTAAAEALEARVGALEDRSAALQVKVDGELTEAIESARVQLDELLVPLREGLEAQMRRHEQRARELADTSRRAMELSAAELEQTLNERLLSSQRRLAEASETFDENSNATLALARQQLARQAEAVGQELRERIKPVLRQVQDEREAAVRELSAGVDAMRQSLRERVDELRQTGQASVDLIEEQLVRRLADLKPQALRAADSAERLLSQRLTRLSENLRASVELTESQLGAKIEELRPRLVATTRAIDADVRAKVAALETEVGTSVGYLERRLTQRVEELVQRSRQALRNEMTGHDDHDAILSGGSPPAPEGGLSVDVFVKSATAAGAGKRAAGAAPAA